MAPNWPEEVDVFSVPHSRMKKLVHKYSNMITATDFRDKCHLKTLLENLKNVFSEFKAHEQIENMLIMRQLRNKLRAASVTSAAVCNCHSDNRLTDMLDLVTDGYRWTQKTERERQLYGRKLKHALEDFTQNFIPHMELEEEVFQPMLMQYFSYEELKDLKAKVIHEHGISKNHEEYHHEKFVEDFYESDDSCNGIPKPECHFSKLPSELCLQIFSYLGPKDLARASQVSVTWHHLSQDPTLWSKLYPVHWALGDWTFYPKTLGGVDGPGLQIKNLMQDEEEQDPYTCLDEDADVDESGDSDGAEYVDSEGLKQFLKEARLLTSIVKHLLPKVGSGVKVCDIAYSRGISSSLIHKILKLCPNMEFLDLTHTKIGDAAFKEYGENCCKTKLKHLDLTGCTNITDLTLISLASAGGKEVMNSTKRIMPGQNLDIEEVEIENVPWPCSQKVPVCCRQRMTSCCRAPVNKEMDKKTSDNQYRQQNKSGACHGNQGVAPASRIQEDPADVVTEEQPIEQMGHPENGDPQSCDLSYVYLEILIEAKEDLSPGNLMSSLENDFANISFMPQPSTFGCDNDAVATLTTTSSSSSSTSTKPSPCLTNRTCGERGNPGLDMQNRNTCCKSASVNLQTADSCILPSPASSPSQGVPEESERRIALLSDISQPSSNDSGCNLEFLSLNGCYQISDVGLSVLAEGAGTPQLSYLDLSGCVGVTGDGLSQLASTAPLLDHSNLFYCDNISDDPFPTTASGCRNRQCGSRFCCSFSKCE